MKSKILIDFDFERNETFLQLRLEGWDIDGAELPDKHLKNFIENANLKGGLHVYYGGAGNGLPQIRAGKLPGSSIRAVSGELLEAAKPLIEYLQKNHHPHVTAIVSCNDVELQEGIETAKL